MNASQTSSRWTSGSISSVSFNSKPLLLTIRNVLTLKNFETLATFESGLSQGRNPNASGLNRTLANTVYQWWRDDNSGNMQPLSCFKNGKVYITMHVTFDRKGSDLCQVGGIVVNLIR
jgi:hypothetical protein